MSKNYRYAPPEHEPTSFVVRLGLWADGHKREASKIALRTDPESERHRQALRDVKAWQAVRRAIEAELLPEVESEGRQSARWEATA